MLRDSLPNETRSDFTLVKRKLSDLFSKKDEVIAFNCGAEQSRNRIFNSLNLTMFVHTLSLLQRKDKIGLTAAEIKAAEIKASEVEKKKCSK